MATLHKPSLGFEHLQSLTTTRRANPYSALLHKNVLTCSFLEVISVSQPEQIQTHSTPSQHTQRLFQARGKELAMLSVSRTDHTVPTAPQQQLHGGDKCTGTSPGAQFCPTEAISHLHYQELLVSCCAAWQDLTADLVFTPSMSRAVPPVR